MRLEITGPIPLLPVLEKALEHHQAVTSLPGQGHGTCQPPRLQEGGAWGAGSNTDPGGLRTQGALAAGGRITCGGRGCHQGCAVLQVSPMDTSREGREGLQKALCNS